jgi:PAS domain S-box-containing protein
VNPLFWSAGDGANIAEEVLWRDSERVVCRRWLAGAEGDRQAVLAVFPAAERPGPDSLNRLIHEYGLKDDLDCEWAARPLELLCERGRTLLLLESPDGEPLDRLIGQPMEIGRFLRLAIALSTAVSRVHERGLVHKDIKPTNVLVSSAKDQVWLTGFGIASRLPRQRQRPEPPEFIAGTLAYMSPEQTGRMNRSIDSRSDLYSLGIMLYQMLTGNLPFTGSDDPMEWVHFHVAKKPVPPSRRSQDVPAPVSAIIMKLLAKTAEERYQTAAGVETDLRRCFAEWETRRRIGEFVLGGHDMPDRVLIPEKLYGRDREIETLLTCFDRVVKSGRPELVLVSGYSGIGKSSVVNELHKVIVPSRGLFASGKFDQAKRDIPYATLAQSFQSLVGSLLSKSEAELGIWRDAFHEALGPNGLLMMDLVPQLKFIIGEQQPVPILPSLDAQRRFQLVFRRFIGVFARPEHPLALFLDDLQWLDAATLDFIEDLLTQPDVRHLALIGAYRDNEIDSTHPLIRKLEAIRKAGAAVQEIVLAPLSCENLGQLLGDSFYCESERSAPLALLIHEKTAGNPFFAIQFISSLAEESLLTFDYPEGRWSWDLNRIRAKDYTDNVVDLMVGKLRRLPVEAQNALKQLACLGSFARVATLSVVYQTPEDKLHADLLQAVRLQLIERLADSYRFVHDRIQEAAYSLIPSESRAEAHLRTGRLLVAHTPAKKRDDAIFEIVNQLNRAVPLITSQEEREHLAELNMIAGKRAKGSTAYASALKYLIAASALLTADHWQRRRDLMFRLELERAECEFLTGELAAADQRLTAISNGTADTVERAIVACLRMDVCTTLDESDRAIAVALDYLQHVGIDWSPHPTDEEVRREYEQIWLRLRSSAIEDVIDWPMMTDPDSLATVDVLTKVLPPALFIDANLACLTICRAVNLSLERGNCDGSCFAYAMLGRVSGPRFGDYHKGFRFGQLGYELVERRGLKRFHGSTYYVFALVLPWMKHVRSCRDLLRSAFEAAYTSGDLTYAAYACNNLDAALLFAGDPLAEVQREAEQGLAFAQRARFGLVVDIIGTQLGLVRMLRGLTAKFGSLDGEHIEELRFEQHLSGNHVLAIAEYRYWIRKLQARYLGGDYIAAVDASLRTDRLVWKYVLSFEEVEYHFYSGLSRAACCEGASAGERQEHLEFAAAHERQLAGWAEHCPENFENRAALVGAEIARIESRDLDAMRLYEKAIHSSRTNGFVHNEALAYECASAFYRARGFDEFADTYLRNARVCYASWGADGKVRQLDRVYPWLNQDHPSAGPASRIMAPVEGLDLATVIQVTQAVSSEIVLDKLFDTVLRKAMEHAGAERGLLIVPRGEELQIEAESRTSGNDVIVSLGDPSAAPAAMPESILRYVMRTHESVILDDASSANSFSADSYFLQNRVRSILCLPLLNQAKLSGVLYLENNLAPRVFTSDRITVLRVLVSQAAISLENTRLYRDLENRECKIRRLVDANIVGIFIWDLEWQIVDANDAFLTMVGYTRDDLAAGRLRWTELTPPEWLDRDLQQRRPRLKATGSLQPFEKEYFRKDGTRVPVLIGAASFEGSGNEGVAFVLDLTERKQAEETLRESVQRYHQAQLELAHANRVATLGQLSASIAHEVNQPIAAIANNASAALRWLGKGPPDLEKARKALSRILANSNRAGEVIGRVRALLKKAPLRKEYVDINEAILEVVAFTRGEVTKNGILVKTQLVEGLPVIQGDRVQLQQVILNLIINGVEAMNSVAERPRELVISTGEAPSEGVLIGVRDLGPGLPLVSPERIFDAFYTTKPSGLGMGLSICRSIIEAHGGRLWANANTPRGATFQFTLPAHAEISDEKVS